MFRAGTLPTLLATYAHTAVRRDAATAFSCATRTSFSISHNNTTTTSIGSSMSSSHANMNNQAGSHLVYPYAVEGGPVPIYSMVHGRVQRRNWVFRNAQWCDLCREPVDHWLNHLSRKDHALLDLHYTAQLEWPRRWSPQQLLAQCAAHLPVPMLSCYRDYASYEKMHRSEIYAMLVELEAAGMVHCGEVRDTFLARMQGGLRGMDNQGALVLHELLLGPFNRLYPDGHIQDYSNLLDFITCSYNLETVYDLCGLYTIDKIAIQSKFKPSSPAALGLGGISTSSSAADGYEHAAELPPSSQAAPEGDAWRTQLRRHSMSAPDSSAHSASHRFNEGIASDSSNSSRSSSGGGEKESRESARARFLALRSQKQQRDRDEEAFSRKAVFMRQVLGQLRWTLLPGQPHPTGRTFAPHLIVLGELCLRALVVELILVRVCEYMMRAEPVWFAFGFERRRLPRTLVGPTRRMDRRLRGAQRLSQQQLQMQSPQQSALQNIIMSCDGGERSDGVVPIMQRWHYRYMSSQHDDLYCVPKEAEEYTEKVAASTITTTTAPVVSAAVSCVNVCAAASVEGQHDAHLRRARTATETMRDEAMDGEQAWRGRERASSLSEVRQKMSSGVTARNGHRLRDSLFRSHPVPRTIS